MAKANFNRAKDQYPSVAMGETEWVAAFDANPDIMWSILGDVFNVILDERDREEGKKRVGRRPVRAAGSREELLTTVLPPQFSQELFPVALRKLIGKRSQRQFAPRVPVTQSTLSRLLSGDAKPDLQLLEAIATAAKVPPFYFVEYRAQFFATAIEQVLTTNPNLGITAWKRYRAGERGLPA